MDASIQPSEISGTVQAPPSKSDMQRACAAALLRRGDSMLYHCGTSADERAAVQIVRDLGAHVTISEGGKTLHIRSRGCQALLPKSVIDCGESGLSLRMFTFLAALSSEPVVVSGRGSLLRRPLDDIKSLLPQLGVGIRDNSGSLPFSLQGPLQPADIVVDGSVSSQHLTGLLMAYAAKGTPATITVEALTSRPYIDMTLKIMEHFGMHMPERDGYSRFVFKKRLHEPGSAPVSYTVEADWSGGAFLLVAGAVAGAVTVTGLDVFTMQGDRRILEALQDCGCSLSVQADLITVRRGQLRAFQFDATDCPDLFPPLAALAAYCRGTSVIAGVHRLRHKESDRAAAIISEFTRLGIPVRIQDDMLLVEGGGRIEGGSAWSHNDHRIAMACAVVALGADKPVHIKDADAVRKSYPDFFAHLQQLAQDPQAVFLKE